MNINCLCIIDPIQEHPSWVKITRLRVGNKGFDYKKVYIPNITALIRAVFEDNDSNNSNDNNIPDNNIPDNTISYYGMENEKNNDESRAYSDGNWIIWNNMKKTFSENIDFGHGNYWVVKFPKDYWDEM